MTDPHPSPDASTLETRSSCTLSLSVLTSNGRLPGARIGEDVSVFTPNLRARVWAKLLTKAELRHVRLHDLRHTYASLLIQQGESLAYVKEQMGHHSIKITVDTYGHLMPGGNKVAVDRLDGLENATVRNPGTISTPTPVLLVTESH